MADVQKCPRCGDARWVCERHPDQPAGHYGCQYPAMRCPLCNSLPRPAMPPGRRTVDD